MKYSPAEIAEQAIDLFMERFTDLGGNLGHYDIESVGQDINRAKAQAINEIVEGCNTVLSGEESKGPAEEYRKYFE